MPSMTPQLIKNTATTRFRSFRITLPPTSASSSGARPAVRAVGPTAASRKLSRPARTTVNPSSTACPHGARLSHPQESACNLLHSEGKPGCWIQAQLVRGRVSCAPIFSASVSVGKCVLRLGMAGITEASTTDPRSGS